MFSVTWVLFSKFAPNKKCYYGVIRNSRSTELRAEITHAPDRNKIMYAWRVSDFRNIIIIQRLWFDRIYVRLNTLKNWLCHANIGWWYRRENMQYTRKLPKVAYTYVCRYGINTSKSVGVCARWERRRGGVSLKMMTSRSIEFSVAAIVYTLFFCVTHDTWRV